MDKTLLESIPVSIRRRISFAELEPQVNEFIHDSLNMCAFEDVGEFIAKVCDIIVYNVIDDFETDENVVTPKERDSLYHYFVEMFGKYLVNEYKKECETINESKITFVISESQYNKYKHLISENDNLSYYSDEDFVEVFIKVFRTWVRQNHGDEVGEHPLAHLVGKYIDEFIKDYNLDVYSYRSGLAKLVSVGRELVSSKKYVLPSLQPTVKFTEKYKKQLQYILNYFDLPDYVKIEFDEPSPNEVNVVIKVDWPTMLITVDGYRFNAPSIYKELIKYLSDFLGVDTGSPAHGKLQINYHAQIDGTDEFIKKIFRKQIRPKIKELDTRGIIHAVKVFAENHRFSVEIKYKSYANWSNQRELNDKVRDLFTEMGFDPEKISVTG